MNRLLPIASLALTFSLAACYGRPRTWSGSRPDEKSAHAGSTDRSTGAGDIAELDLTKGAPEASSSSLLSPGSRQTFFRLVKVLKDLPADKNTKGVLVRLGSANFGWAHAQELAGLFAKVRESKKPVVCHADGYGNATLWIAARGCDRIWVSPAGGIEAVGIAAEMIYANRLLADKLGIDVDFLQIGRFKGAEEPFTRNGPSPEAKASLESVLGAIREQWLTGLGEGRGQLMREAAEEGPFSAEDAKQRGIVDAIGYMDQARDEAKQLSLGNDFGVRFGTASHAPERPDFAEFLRVLSGGPPDRGGPPHVVVVRAIGSISMAGGGGLFGGSSGITERGLSRTIRALTDDDSAKAVVLRIDSPGGSALASDLIWRSLMQLRAKKPLIVSIGDMAASGGYYLASTAARIYAEPTSIVGSIGVVGGKLAFGPALENIGVHVEPIGAPGSKAAARASYESPLLPWDAETRERVRSEMTAVYDLFLRRVAEGRNLPVERIAGAAEGRIFAGPVAKELQLVDEWGGLDDAILGAKQLAHLGEDAPVQLSDELGGILGWLDSSNSDDDAESASVTSLLRGPLAKLRTEAPGLDNETRLFLQSLAPLVRGEKTLTALPFLLLLH